MARQAAVIISDAHLQTRTWRHRPIFGDACHSFTQAIDYAIELQIPVIGAGDLIDRRVNEPEPIVFLMDELSRLTTAGGKFYFTQGQHELDDTPWFNIGGADVIHVNKTSFRIHDSEDGIPCYGLDYQPKDKLQEELDKIDRKSTRLNSSHVVSSYAVFCLKKKND